MATAKSGLNMLEEAIGNAWEAYELSVRIESKFIENKSLELLSLLAYKKGNYKDAYEFRFQSQVVKESLFDEKQSQISDEWEARYQNQLRIKEIEELNLAKEEQSRQMFWLILGMISILTLLAITISLYWSRRKTSIILDTKNKAFEKANKELIAAKAELNQKNEELSKYIKTNMQLENFLFLASHDLKEPMRTIVSFSQLLSRRCEDVLDKTTKEYLDFIIDATKRMERLISDLKDFAMVESTDVARTPVPIARTIDTVLQDLRASMEQKNAKVSIEDLPAIVYADEQRMYQLFQNLISNAIKYSKPDKQPKIKISCEEKKEELLFRVKDNGIGISSDYFDKIFLLFKKLDNSDKTNSSGMGLAICKKIVEQHQGRIWVESQPDKGSCFYFTIKKLNEPVLN